MAVSDSELKARVEEALRSNTRVDPNEVQVEVRDSQVFLTGAVDSAIEKRNARHLAEDIEGVRGVTDRLEVKNFVRRPDDELAEAVRIALQRDAFVDAARIEVYASNGEIRLDGEVADYHMRKAAADVAWWTPGVINVENLLLVTEEDFVDVSPGQVVDA